MGATLQTVTKGRFILGIGAGWKEDEYTEYGFHFPSAKQRIEQLEESVQIIKKMWTQTTVNFTGRYYTLNNAHCYPKPNPVPPILIGGGGEKLTLRVVARHADWWNMYDLSPRAYQHKQRIIRKHCRDVNRNPSDIVFTLANSVAIAEKEEQVWKLADQSPFIQRGSEENYLIGTPHSVIEQLQEYIKIGVEYFILRFVDFPRSQGADLFAKRVIPFIFNR
jgi:alkanesulfonate monooxygenase SsuD/methylene tetrahydromethanopterin reductase-like flavin-dependent oxidoreductase (luciferase family)